MMSSKRVSFPPSSSMGTKSYRSRESARDSGFDSLSSEQASSGGRPDRMFTAQTHDQRWDIHALQKAYDQAINNVEHYKTKCQDLDASLTKAHKVTRETEALRKAQCDHSEQLQQELAIVKKDYAKLHDSYDILYRNHCELRQKYENQPMENPMMPADVALPIRVVRKHDGDDKRMKDRMKARMSPKDESASKSSHRSGRDRSRAPDTKQGAYIEEIPSSKKNYKTSSESRRASMSYASVPRASQAISSSIYHLSSDFPDGNYHAFPLPAEPR